MATGTQTAEVADAVFDALSHSRRRHALRRLEAADVPMAVADLAVEVAAREAETTVDEVTLEIVKRVHLSLHHSHVPKLADANLVRFDADRGTVELAEPASRLDRYLESFPVE